MTLILTVVHVMVALGLIFVVLLQRSSGADMGAAFGGTSQGVFGASGAGSFMGKVTAGLATIFMVTSLALAFFSSEKGRETSVMEGVKAPSAQEQAVAPKAVEPEPTTSTQSQKAKEDEAFPTVPKAADGE